MAGDPISAKDFGASFKGFMEQMVSQAPTEEPFFRRRLQQHLNDPDPAKLCIVGESFEAAEHPNVQLALDLYLGADGRTAELLGIAAAHMGFMDLSLAQLVAPAGSGFMGGAGPSEAPVRYVNIALQEGAPLACIQMGLYLVSNHEERLAILVQGPRTWE